MCRKPISAINSHNPYFSRWFSAIVARLCLNCACRSHNPYFSRWFSAMLLDINKFSKSLSHNPYFSRWFSAINKVNKDYLSFDKSQSLF